MNLCTGWAQSPDVKAANKRVMLRELNARKEKLQFTTPMDPTRWPDSWPQDSAQGLPSRGAHDENMRYLEDGMIIFDEATNWCSLEWELAMAHDGKKDPIKSTFSQLEVDRLIREAGFRNSDLESALRSIQSIINNVL